MSCFLFTSALIAESPQTVTDVSSLLDDLMKKYNSEIAHAIRGAISLLEEQGHDCEAVDAKLKAAVYFFLIFLIH